LSPEANAPYVFAIKTTGGKFAINRRGEKKGNVGEVALKRKESERVRATAVWVVQNEIQAQGGRKR